MKRLIPYWIAAVAGVVLIIAYFIPITQGWGEVTAIWFDILQSIAFILGGGNLLKIHLKKASDKPAGWGYSIIVIISFLTMLGAGLLKLGVPPAPLQEHYGRAFARLPLASIPQSQVFSVEGTIPDRGDAQLPKSVRTQMTEAGGRISFLGWMRSDQRSALLGFADTLVWQCNVENLYKASQPAGELSRDGTPLVAYWDDHSVVSFQGRMTDPQKQALVDLGGDALWVAAIDELYDQTQATTTVTVQALPPLFDPASLPPHVSFDPAAMAMSVRGPMEDDQRDGLYDLFPIARPLAADRRATLLDRLRSMGPVEPRQVAAFDKVLDGSWTVVQLHHVLDEAGEPQTVPKTACEMYQEQQDGVSPIEPDKIVGTAQVLNKDQVALLGAFAAQETVTVDDLAPRLAKAGPFSDAQENALRSFLGTLPSAGERDKALCFAMMKAAAPGGPTLSLDLPQRDLLLAPYRSQVAWERTVWQLYAAAHTVKFPWSGEYNAQGAPFWWLYEYLFKPLQATIFAMLAFYVASAAFRAFRAKNIEAILLLSTAFIILLGRTFAGVFLTEWMPPSLSGLRIENLSVYIMQVFNTAGNRAIMIGIALGIASTSLKVLLGVDRSYLGSAEE